MVPVAHPKGAELEVDDLIVSHFCEVSLHIAGFSDPEEDRPRGVLAGGLDPDLSQPLPPRRPAQSYLRRSGDDRVRGPLEPD
ncbi:MAG: hypothetical protein ACUVRH_05415, partial [Candidatus Bipolaricaulia bacterium]